MIEPLADIFRAYDAGHAALLVDERSLYDLVVDEDGRMVTAMEAVRRIARAEYGMHLISYSMANGFDWSEVRIEDTRDRSRIAELLRLNGLLDVPQDQNEVVRVLRGIAAMGRSPRGALSWADGREMKFAFLLEFGEHLAPLSSSPGSHSDAQLVAIELAHITGQSLALRASGNLVMMHGRHSLIDPLVVRSLHRVRFRHPDLAEKRGFIAAASRHYASATFGEGLDAERAARATVNTPNRTIEQLLRGSERTSTPLSVTELVAQKSRDVVALSDESLAALDPARVAHVRLVGRNAEVPGGVLARLGERLAAGDGRMPANVLLAGGPGTGKTDLAILTANAAAVTAYQMHSPKRGIVGETERVARLQHELLDYWSPNVAFVDEITESLPLDRDEHNGDSGASRAVMAALLTTLSDERRRGRSLLIATTNCPWRMSSAMRSRFLFIPVLQPLREDIPAIIAETAARIVDTAALDPGHPAVVEAACTFHAKGANPRHIRAALSTQAMETGRLEPDDVLRAARDLNGMTDRLSADYADLWAIRACASQRFFPWYESPSTYAFPPYLQGIVDEQTGELNQQALASRIEELRPHAHV